MDLPHHNRCAHCQALQSDRLQTASGHAAVPQMAVETLYVTRLRTSKMLWCNILQITIRENAFCDNTEVFVLLDAQNVTKKMNNYYFVL